MVGIPLGVQLGDRFSLAHTFELAELADRRGLQSIWVPEGRLTRDGITMVTALAARTERIRVGSGVLNTRTRNAALTAVTYKTLHELHPDRVFLGLGAWWEPLATQLGLPLERPVASMREYVAAIRSLVAGETVTTSGHFVTLDGARFEPVPDAAPLDALPIHLAAVGPQMLELAGEIADGVNLDFLLPPSWLVGAFERLDAGLAKRSDGVSSLEVSMLIATSIDDRAPRDAIDACKRFLAMYLANQPHIAAASGADPDLVDAVRSVCGRPADASRIADAAKLIPDSFAHDVMACGTTDQAMEAYERYLAAGVQVPVIAPLGDATATINAVIDAFSV